MAKFTLPPISCLLKEWCQNRRASAVSAEGRPDHRAAGVVRQAADVFGEPGRAFAVKIGFDVRHVESRDVAPLPGDRIRDGPHRVGASHIADDWNDTVTRLERLDELERAFLRKIVP